MDIEQIYTSHIEAFKREEIKFEASPEERKYKNVAAVSEALKSGEIIPEMIRQCASHALSPAQQIGFWTLLNFSGKEAERKFKKAFIYAASKIINNK